MSTRGLRTPFLRVAKNGRTYAAGDYTAPGGVGAEIGDQLSDSKLLALFADGATLVLQGLHRTWAPISRFSGDLAAELGHPVQVNAYVTPAQNTGFSDHYDVHDVFVVQIAGTKTWRIRPPVLAHPLRTQPWENRKAAVQQAATRPPLIETTLQPGDTLYLPRGFIHAASARGEVSTHLTIGIHTWTGHHLGRQLQSYAATRLAADPRVRASLPAGIDLADTAAAAADPAVIAAVDAARETLIAAIKAAPVSELVAALAPAHRDGTRPEPVAPIATVMAADSMAAERMATEKTAAEGLAATGIAADGPSEAPAVRLRAGLAARLERRGEELVLSSRLGVQPVEAAHEGALRSLLAGETLAVAQLGVAETQHLLRAGVVVLAPIPGASMPGG